jgi:hypothetical protein
MRRLAAVLAIPVMLTLTVAAPVSSNAASRAPVRCGVDSTKEGIFVVVEFHVRSKARASAVGVWDVGGDRKIRVRLRRGQRRTSEHHKFAGPHRPRLTLARCL